jgi:glucose-1-phosphate thymidylyltransferase
MIVTGGNHAGEFLRLLGNGSAFGLQHLDYAYQAKSGGIAEALGLAEYFAGGEPVVVLLGDNIFEHSIAGTVKRFAADPRGARIVLAKVANPGAYGVAELRDGKLVRIVEKPTDPPSDLVATGIYGYDARVCQMVKTLTPSGRGELEITDVNNRYLQLGELRHEELTGYWADCGESFDMLLRANTLVAERGANKPLP